LQWGNGWGFGFPHFQKQLRLIKKALSDLRRCLSPSDIQLPGLPAGELVPREYGRHLLAVLQVGTCHRHQVFHRYLRGDLARAYLLLHGVGKKLDQRQATGHPTHTAIELAGQLFQPIAESLLELRQQPAFFECAFSFRPMQRTIQHQGLHFVQRPDHRFNGVPAELLEGGDALKTVNDQIAIRLVGNRDDDDRRLLSDTRQRRQQLPLPLWMAHSQVFMAAVQLVKLQLHAFSASHPNAATEPLWDCIEEGGSVSESLAESAR
jgi:hypothetical protein